MNKSVNSIKFREFRPRFKPNPPVLSIRFQMRFLSPCKKQGFKPRFEPNFRRQNAWNLNEDMHLTSRTIFEVILSSQK